MVSPDVIHWEHKQQRYSAEANKLNRYGVLRLNYNRIPVVNNFLFPRNVFRSNSTQSFSYGISMGFELRNAAINLI